jgi:hypothetical protein
MHPGTVSTAAWRWIESSQQLEPGGSPPSRHELLIHERTLGLSALNQRLQTHFNARASITTTAINSYRAHRRRQRSQDHCTAGFSIGRLVNGWHWSMRCTGLVCLTEVRKTTCGPKWQHSCQAQSSTSSKNVPLRPLLSSILGRWLSRRRWETGRSSGAAWSCQQRRNR